MKNLRAGLCPEKNREIKWKDQVVIEISLIFCPDEMLITINTISVNGWSSEFD